jgi:hypothetical protein
MPVSLRLLVRSACLFSCLLFSVAAWAQQASMTLYVFKKGLPQQFIEVLVDGRVLAFTNDRGVAEVQVSPGLRHLELRDQDLVVLDQQILVHEGELSQWIVNITRGLSSLVDIESSSGVLAGSVEATQAEQSQAGPGQLSGHLLSADDGAPVVGARIFISGLSTDIRSDAEGRFEAELPSGS